MQGPLCLSLKRQGLSTFPAATAPLPGTSCNGLLHVEISQTGILTYHHTLKEPVAGTSRTSTILESDQGMEKKLSPLKSPMGMQTPQAFSSRSPRKDRLRKEIEQQKEEIRIIFFY
ncbi:hypothetical protein NQ317_013233 [Molorchus minor]|uniref:Uncharacterized protein n=1 Tax=Molorchus minor TaxID=1323400 RepID=A0ABQ9JT88_9CUCU|nr:hypothetical protein NQ317_013233 [Molorchus minor]